MFLSRTIPMPRAAVGHTCTPLPDGGALLVGGWDESGDRSLQSLLFDPAARAFTWGPPLPGACIAHTATRLLDGRVLVIGCGPRRSTLLYNPPTQTWRPAARAKLRREGHTATLLRDGRVLVAGGFAERGASERAPSCTARTEFFYPSLGLWIDGPPLVRARSDHQALGMPDGSVLVVGGEGPGPDGSPGPVRCAERFDPARGAWRQTTRTWEGHPYACALPDGRALVSGGGTPELLDDRRSSPTEELWRRAGPMVSLADGRVACFGAEAIEVFDPASGSWEAAGQLLVPRVDASVTRLDDGSLLVAGGSSPSGRPVEFAEWIRVEPERQVDSQRELAERARSLVSRCLSAGWVELVDGATPEDLVDGVRAVLSGPTPSRGFGAPLARLFLAHEAVAEVWVDDEQLGALTRDA